MEEKNLSKKLGFGFFWKIMENGGAQGVQFYVSVLLARLLSPKEYDLITLATVFISFANVLVQNGFSTALIQKKEAEREDYSSVLFLNLGISALLYGLLYGAAPYIAAFYRKAELVGVFRALGLVLFPGGVISVQNAYVSKKMQFRALFLASFGGALLSGIVSVYLAGKGQGVYALVWQQLVYYFSLMLLLFVCSDLRFGLQMSFRRLGLLFAFGWKILAASLLDTAFQNLHALVIGKVYQGGTLGNYNRGEQFPKLIVHNLGSAIQFVMLPLMSEKQDRKEELRFLLQNTVRLSAYLTLPLMAGMIATADSIVLVLLGEKWRGAIPFLRFLSLSYACWPIHIANLQAINALGRSDEFLKLELIKKLLGLLTLFVGVSLGSIELVALKALADFIGIFINAYPNKKLLSYDVGMQLRDIFPSFVLSAVMGGAVYMLGRYLPVSFGHLLLLIIIGAVLYLVLSVCSKNESFYFLLEQIKGKEGKRNAK